MDDDVTEVEHQPTGVFATLGVMWYDPFFLQCSCDFVLDSAELTLAVSTTEDKVIRKATDITHVQQEYIAGLFITGDFSGAAGDFN